MQLTSNQQQVLAVLKESPAPLSAYELLGRLREAGFSAPTQVYRALERLTEMGLVHRLETLNAYVSCVKDCGCLQVFRAFAICDVCGHVDEFVDEEIAARLGRWAQSNTFALKNSTIEIHGRCAACSMAGSPA